MQVDTPICDCVKGILPSVHDYTPFFHYMALQMICKSCTPNTFMDRHFYHFSLYTLYPE